MSVVVFLSRYVWVFFSSRVFLLSITYWPFCLLHRLPQSLSLALSVWVTSQQSPVPSLSSPHVPKKKRVFPDFFP
jgi:hypothetical protein